MPEKDLNFSYRLRRNPARQKLSLKMAFSVSYCRKELLLRCCRHSGSASYGSTLQNVILIWRKPPPKLIQWRLYGNHKIVKLYIYFSRRGSRAPFNILDGSHLGETEQLLRIKYYKKKLCTVCWWYSSTNLCYDISQNLPFYSGEAEM